MRKLLFSIIFMGALTASFSCSRSAEESADSVATAEHVNPLSDPLDFKADDYRHSAPAGVNIPSGPRHNDRIYVKNLGNLREVFLDSNKYQYAWAERIGIEPIRGLNDAYRTRRPLVKISDCEAYGVDNLTHSLPYLVPEAAQLLERVGYDFIDTLARRGVDGYKIKVTSLLRTPATVKSLRRRNVNATDSSTHQFGTTFDLSWSKFICADTTRTIHEGDLKNVLAEVLYNLRRQGKCMVVFERKTCCFHITVTPGRKPDEL
ncbi:MAG: hypothetical protein K2M14_05160 [Muribaculaceae bacterium]|nr:hypothetical protein [Muribaculaceae bacterium]